MRTELYVIQLSVENTLTTYGGTTLKTPFESIVDVSSIGMSANPIKMNEILRLANLEELTPISQDVRRVFVLLIDFQNSFMETGELAVPKSHGDIERTTRWIYDNMEKISKICVSLDTHNPFQIFHACWWIDENGNNPPPFTTITLKDLNDDKWKAVIQPEWSREYVENLEQQGQFQLTIWPYHCLQGTYGSCLEGQLGNMIYFQSVAKKSMVQHMVKGNNPKTEMYGILKAEYDPQNRINISFLNDLKKYDKIVIAGEAKSHCVRRSIEQILDYFKNDIDVTKNIYILEDCMSSIPISPEFIQATDDAFEEFKTKYKVNLVKSTDFKLEDVI
jgi:nicotinamidase-related amidase